MAAMVGSRPETVIRALSELEADGLINIQRRRITIPSLDPLIDATGISDT
jgi:DNA-binding transcriptional regulator YhcF (GntR family)